MKSVEKFLRESIGVGVIALVALLFVVIGCSDTDTTSTINAPDTTADLTATIAGKVVDSGTGAAIAGATVSVAGLDISTTTAEDGSFRLEEVPRTEVNNPIILSITGAPDNYPATSNAVVNLISDPTGPVEPTVVVSGIEIELHDRGGTINGQVLNVNGTPLEGIPVTLDPVEIPLPAGPGDVTPTTGVKPFTLSADDIRATTDAEGRFSFTNVPENWIYNVTLVLGGAIPGSGASNITFTNQWVPTGSTLDLPDATGAPIDSAVGHSFNLAGFPSVLLLPAVNGFLLPVPPGAAVPGIVAPLAAGGPIVINPALLPGEGGDTIPPFVLANSEIKDGTVIPNADNTPGRSLSFTLSEPLANDSDDLAINLKLAFLGPGTTPFAGTVMTFIATGGMVQEIPIDVMLDDSRTMVTLTPNIQVPDPADPTMTVPGSLPGGVFAITGGPLSAGFPTMLNFLRDDADNPYTGATPPSLTCPPDCDVAQSVEVSAGLPADAEIDFVVLREDGVPGAPSIASIRCEDCNNSTILNMAATAIASVPFTITFDSVPGAVLYQGLFAVEGDDTFTAGFMSAGPLQDPPERIPYQLQAATGVPITLTGFPFPLLEGTETTVQIPNNFFDNGRRYQVGVQAQNNAGILGPQATNLVRDVVPPAFDISAMLTPTGNANNINNKVGVGVVPVFPTNPNGINTVLPYTPLAVIFSPSATPSTTGDSIPIREGAMAGTVDFDFFRDVVNVTVEDGFVIPGVYSAGDLAMLGSVPGSLNIRIDEEIRARENIIDGPAVVLTDPTVSNPALPGFFADGTPTDNAPDPRAYTGMVTNAVIFDPNPANLDELTGDGLADEDLIEVTIDPIFSAANDTLDTGLSIDFSTSGITDEAGNPLSPKGRASTSLFVANFIPAAITEAVASRPNATTDRLELSFTRPISIRDVVDADNMLTSSLGLQDGGTGLPDNRLIGGTATLDMAGTMLTIDLPTGTLSGLPLTTVISGMPLIGGSLRTDDALDFGPAGPLNVNAFEGGQAAIIVENQVPVGLINIISPLAPGSPTINSGLSAFRVGVSMGMFTIAFVFDGPVLTGPPFVVPDGVSLPNMIGATNIFAEPSMVIDPPNEFTIPFDVTLNPGGGTEPLAEGATITINGVTGLNGLDAFPDTATLNAAGAGINIGGVNIP